MPTFIPCHLGFKGSRCFQAGREHGAIGELDADFRAFDGVFVEFEAADDLSNKFLTFDHARSFLIYADTSVFP
ncbi:MAG: hypothetical protein J0G35_01400 [Acidobacteriales bacterium]|nr:hypothetical protein [Terriglobales bacterium]